MCGPASLGSWNGHTRAHCQRGAEGSRHFPRDFPFAVCLEGYTAVRQTQEELEACRDHCLHPTCPTWKEALPWTDNPLTPAGGSLFPGLEILWSLQMPVAHPADNSGPIPDLVTRVCLLIL